MADFRGRLGEIFSKARLWGVRETKYTKHPGSKNRKRHNKKIRAAQKRAKMSRKRNRRKR